MRKLLTLIIIGLLIACDGDETVDFDRQAILNNVTEKIIIPTYQNFESKSSALVTATQSFNADPSIVELSKLKTIWLETKLAWATCETVNFGPIDDFAIETQVNFWPTDIDGIESNISTFSLGTNYDVILGSNKKGLAAIEYLLFSAEENEVLAQLSNIDRRAMLLFYANNIQELAQQIISHWQTGYADEYLTLTGNGSESGATLLANQIILTVEQIQKMKIAEPLGFNSFSDPDANNVESPYAKVSADLIKVNILAIKEAFNGGQSTGFDDYLNHMNALGSADIQLSEVINAQFDICIGLSIAMSPSLQYELTIELGPLNELYDELQQLIVLLKTQMMPQLGLVVIYSDADGDS
ncbi:MAG: imelysin family protein [Reichenbachiella sp.]